MKLFFWLFRYIHSSGQVAGKIAEHFWKSCHPTAHPGIFVLRNTRLITCTWQVNVRFSEMALARHWPPTPALADQGPPVKIKLWLTLEQAEQNAYKLEHRNSAKSLAVVKQRRLYYMLSVNCITCAALIHQCRNWKLLALCVWSSGSELGGKKSRITVPGCASQDVNRKLLSVIEGRVIWSWPKLKQTSGH